MSSGQSLKNGNSVEPGLPNTFLMPNARNSSSVACLTVVGAPEALGDLRDNAATSIGPQEVRRPSLRGAQRRSNPHYPHGRMDCFVASLLAMTVSPRCGALHL